MPAFQMPTSSAKRKLEASEEESLRKKRISLDLTSRSLSDRANENGVSCVQEQVWMVQWRNPQYRKHKTWDGDGILTVNASEALLYDSDGKILARGKVALPLCEGRNLSFASKELELERMIPRSQFLSGSCFGRTTTITITSSPISSNTHNMKQFIPPSSNSRGLSETPVYPVHQLETEDESMPTPSNKELSNITNQPSYWTVNWRKPQGKKNKTWDGDAYVSHVGDKLIMTSEDGKIMGSTSWNGQTLSSGFRTSIAGKELELDIQVEASQLPTIQSSGISPLNNPSSPDCADTVPPNSIIDQKIVVSTTFYAPAQPKVKRLLHDPQAPDAVVMKSPTKEHMRKFNKRNLPVVPVVLDPILSRKMRPHQIEGLVFLYESVMGLRKHEGQGCILADEMGLGKTLQTIALVWTLIKQNPYAGPLPVVQKVLIVCPVSLVSNWKAEFHKWLGRDRVGIIACDRNSDGIDIFGRSKVHQVLIIGYERLRMVVKKLEELHPPIGLIICDEGHRLKSANNKTAAIFKTLSSRRRIILSGTPIQNDLGEFHTMAEFCNPGLLDDYSVFRKVYENPILKSRAPDALPKEVELGEARTEQLLSIARSFVLRRDATLLQTHLPPKSEYVVFITPTMLQLSMFYKILNPDKLNDLIQSSTAESLALINILTKISNSPILLKATADNVKKKNGAVDPVRHGTVHDALDLLPTKAHIADMSLSGKLLCLATMLKMIRQNTSEKCVVVSHYTSTLNILEAYCKKSSYSHYRLDGQTPQNKRQEYVNAFNRESQHNSFIFLLSSKAGGVGINLIGASRLFIIDSDWNPSHDLQSMARCHRDGQKRPVFIYRFLTAGAIDEKIYQRQVTKLALSDSLIGSGTMNSKSDSFTRKDLRDIFRIHMDTGCNTHDLLECGCDCPESQIPNDFLIKDGEDLAIEQGFIAASELRQERLDTLDKAYLQKKKAGLAALGEWTHINCMALSSGSHIQDDILRKVVSISTDGNNAEASVDRQRSVRDVPGGTISFLFEKCSKTVLVNSDDEDSNL